MTWQNRQMMTSNKSIETGAHMDLPCPNCGQTVRARISIQRLLCPNCNEELEWSADGRKLLLTRPLLTYQEMETEATQIAAIWNQADQSDSLIDLRRRQAMVELATRWLGERIALGKRYFKIGGGLSFVAIFVLLVALVRIFLTGAMQLDAFILFILSAFIIPFGFFFLSWSMVDRFAVAKYIKRIQEERRLLQEEEQALRN